MAEEKKFQHNTLHLVTIILAFLVAVVQLIFGFFHYSGDVFVTQSYEEINVAHAIEAWPEYAPQILPVIIFGIQVTWTIYQITLIWRRGNSDYLYVNPNPINMLVNVFFIIACCLNITWMVLWDQDSLLPAMVVVGVAAVCADVALGIVNLVYFRKVPELVELNKDKDIVYIEILVINCLSGLENFLAFHLCVLGGIYAVEEGTFNDEDASSMVIALWYFIVLLSVLLSDFIFPVRMRFNFLRYAVWVAYVLPVVATGFNTDMRNDLMALVLLIVIGLFMILKVIRMCMRVREIDEKDDVAAGLSEMRQLPNLPVLEIEGASDPEEEIKTVKAKKEKVKKVKVAKQKKVVVTEDNVAADLYPTLPSAPVVSKADKKKNKKKVKKILVEEDIDGEINLAGPSVLNALPAGRYKVVQAPVPTEFLQTEPAVHQVEILNTPQTRTVPVYSAQQAPSLYSPQPVEIVPQPANILYQQSTPQFSQNLLSQPLNAQNTWKPANPQPIFNQDRIRIEPVTDPNQLSMLRLQNLSSTPMGILTLPKPVVPQAQAHVVPQANPGFIAQPANAYGQTYGNCGTVILNQPSPFTFGQRF